MVYFLYYYYYYYFIFIFCIITFIILFYFYFFLFASPHILYTEGKIWETTVDDSGVGQQQLNGTASKTILKWSEYHEIHRGFFMG